MAWFIGSEPGHPLQRGAIWRNAIAEIAPHFFVDYAAVSHVVGGLMLTGLTGSHSMPDPLVPDSLVAHPSG